jgi:pimeloyl-ACP methyl ester carboxylesterase
MSSPFDHPALSQRYFFPRRDPLPQTLWVECNEVRLSCFRHAPHAHGRTLVHFHGNGEVAADYLGPFVDEVTACGLNLFLAEYRGYGQSSGVPAMDAMLDDVPALLEAADVRPERIILFGRSVGSIYAIHGASCVPEVAGLIVESGIADPFERALLRVRPEELGVSREDLELAASQRLDHRAKLGSYQGPVLVMHARDDSLVPVDNAQRLAEWAAAPCRLRVFESGDHNAIQLVNWSAYWQEVRAFVDGLDAMGDNG